MKKILLFILILTLLLGGCGVSNRAPYAFDSSDIEEIFVYSMIDSLEYKYSKKNITSEYDMNRILEGLNHIKLRRSAKEKDIPAGGSPMYVELIGQDESVVICLYDKIILFSDKKYVLEKEVFSEEIFWNSLNYKSEEITNEELPEKNSYQELVNN